MVCVCRDGILAQTFVFFIILLVAPTSAAAPPHLLILPSDGNGRFHTNFTVLPNLAGKNRDGYLGIFTHSANHFSIYPPSPFNCKSGLATVRDTSLAHKCIFAVNGDPFNMSGGGGCTGTVVSDGHEIASDFSGGDTMFGVTMNGSWVIGRVDNSSSIRSLGITQLVTGFNWLVYNGVSAVGAGGEQAPRTAIGIHKNGKLMILEVDGCEKCQKGRGPTMGIMADLLIAQGARHAVNLDGGGSSTTVIRGKVVNKPTCADIAFVCQRKVSTVVCVGQE